MVLVTRMLTTAGVTVSSIGARLGMPCCNASVLMAWVWELQTISMSAPRNSLVFGLLINLISCVIFDPSQAKLEGAA